MKPGSKLRVIAYLLAFGGALLVTVLIVREGATRILSALASASWALPVVVTINSGRLLSDGTAWFVLVPKANRPRFLTAVWIRWVGGCVNELLPSARLSADILTARLATISGGLSPSLAAGASAAGLSVSVPMRILVTVGALLLIAGVTGQRQLYFPSLLAGLTALMAILGFYTVQRFGLFRLATPLISRVRALSKSASVAQGGAKFDQTLQAIYRRPRALLICALMWTVSWLIGCVETWIALFALGIPTSFTVALIVETAGQGVRIVLFIVPAGLGVFEGGTVMICNLLGIPSDIALALALIRRAQEALFSVPGLVVWQLVEARRVFRRMGGNERERAGASESAGNASKAGDG
jgi:putative membrane protein